ncbi:CAIB/BAIF family enzyme [Taphrina deformans PYCC 5710]|uniref:CAIB/BAIF family enzyme n=1 Tax=Taphrina deformans (strain PYCC 5710 / ATCC 11124 / CBS 356.35 / IMI 108563 / JCM 9778 / NBRC 8474) TaxID=1097556 RepID=R4X6X4_TAPDE|nr:CAIB/BAIF family enzyme [Taphrina deformans PYCC 5710]|eukprot:CCG80731.1 CAIB/BAIF family enzyme [Taphrina deformans PYCC 5710]
MQVFRPRCQSTLQGHLKRSNRQLATTSHTRPTDFEGKGPLAGIKVLDLTRVLAGPYCTQMLADNGADVIKIEIPRIGDDTRHWKDATEQSQFWKSGAQTSLYFSSCNRSKRSLAVNLKSAAGVGIIKELVKECDVVVDNYLPGKLDELGIGYGVLSGINPRVIHASVSGYGSSGPYARRAGYDVIAAAECGMLHITGERGGLPVKPGVALIDLCTGLYSYGAITSALYARQFTGVGQKIDASLLETGLSLMVNLGSSYLNMDREAVRYGCGHPSIVPYDTFTCSDAMIVVGATSDRQWATLMTVLGHPELIEDARFRTNSDRVAHRKDVEDLLNAEFSKRTIEEWCAELESTGLPFGPVNTLERAFDHPQVGPRKMIETLKTEASKSGELKVAGIPVKYSHTKPSIKGPPPSIGEHSHEVLLEMGYSRQEVQEFASNGVVQLGK